MPLGVIPVVRHIQSVEGTFPMKYMSERMLLLRRGPIFITSPYNPHNCTARSSTAGSSGQSCAITSRGSVDSMLATARSIWLK